MTLALNGRTMREEKTILSNCVHGMCILQSAVKSMNPHMTMNVVMSFVVEIDAPWRIVSTQQFSIISQFSYRRKLVIFFLS